VSSPRGGRPPARLVDLHRDFDRGFFGRLYATVLVPSFPPDELESEAVLGQALAGAGEGPETMGLAAVDAVGEPAGTIISTWYREPGVLLLGYLAVRADDRGQGLGSWLMHEALDRWSSVPGCALVLGEVEDPRHFAGPAAERRVEFHARAGAEVLAAPYFQPRLRPEAQRVHHLLLTVFWSAPQARRNGGIDGGRLRHFLAQYVAVTEGTAALESDPAIGWLLGFYGTDVVPLVPLARFGDVPHPEPPTAG